MEIKLLSGQCGMNKMARKVVVPFDSILPPNPSSSVCVIAIMKQFWVFHNFFSFFSTAESLLKLQFDLSTDI